MEKLKAEEEKQMNRIRKPDREKGRKTKAKTAPRGAVISTAAVPGWNDDSRADSHTIASTQLSDFSCSVFQSPVNLPFMAALLHLILAEVAARPAKQLDPSNSRSCPVSESVVH